MESPFKPVSISNAAKRFFKFKREELSDAKQLKKFYVCNLCLKEINGTKEYNLVAHLKQKHPENFKEIDTKKTKSAQQKRLELLQHCVEMVTVNGRPFSALLDSGFQRIIEKKLLKLKNANLSLDLNHTGLSDVKNYIQIVASKIRETMKCEVQDRIFSLLLDIGTRHRGSFLGISAQYFIGAKLTTRCVGMIVLEQSHTGTYISDMIISCMREYNVSPRQIITITTDNAGNVTKSVRDFQNELSIAELGEQLQQTFDSNVAESNCAVTNGDEAKEGDEFIDLEIEATLFGTAVVTDDEALDLLFDDNETIDDDYGAQVQSATNQLSAAEGCDFLLEITNVRCSAHTLQLAIKDALRLLESKHKNIIELCQQSAKILRTELICIRLKRDGIDCRVPRLEVNTRWCSTYLMVSE